MKRPRIQSELLRFQTTRPRIQPRRLRVHPKGLMLKSDRHRIGQKDFGFTH